MELKKNVITVSRSPSKAGRLAQRRLMAAACPTLAPNCLLHLRLAFFLRRGFTPQRLELLPGAEKLAPLLRQDGCRHHACHHPFLLHCVNHNGGGYCPGDSSNAHGMWLKICGKYDTESVACIHLLIRLGRNACPDAHVVSNSRNNALHLPGLQLRPLPLLTPVPRHQHPGLPARDVRGLNLVEIPPPVRYRTPPSPCSNCEVTNTPRGQTNVAGPYSHTRG